nr:hypothetical protein [Rhodococcus wratislaviensis]
MEIDDHTVLVAPRGFAPHPGSSAGIDVAVGDARRFSRDEMDLVEQRPPKRQIDVWSGAEDGDGRFVVGFERSRLGTGHRYS